VDDILSEGDSMQKVLANKNQIKALLIAGGFELNKWANPHEDLCPDGDNSQRLFSDSRKVDALGII